MASQEELDLERDRIKTLVHTLGNVLETIGAASENVGTALTNLQIAQRGATTAEALLTQSAKDTAEYVTRTMTGLPAAVSAKLLKELDGSIQKSVESAVTKLSKAAEAATQSAAALDKAVKLKLWTMVGIAVGASVLAGCITSAIICVWVLRAHTGT